jgi:plasmid stability protein
VSQLQTVLEALTLLGSYANLPRDATSVEAEAIAIVKQMMQAEPAWLPILSAPNDGRDILVYFKTAAKNGNYAILHVDNNQHGQNPLRGYCSSDQTYWMELPSPPKGSV